MLNTETIVKTQSRCKYAFHVADTVTAVKLASKLSKSSRRVCSVVLRHVLRFRPCGIVKTVIENARKIEHRLENACKGQCPSLLISKLRT